MTIRGNYARNGFVVIIDCPTQLTITLSLEITRKLSAEWGRAESPSLKVSVTLSFNDEVDLRVVLRQAQLSSRSYKQKLLQAFYVC